MMENVSVIVPVYKVEQFLQECVDSVISQSFSDYELILVDDGTPDNCARICDDYALEKSNVITIHKTNGGLSDARNKGIDVASGQSLVFIDSDDYVSESFLETLVENAQAEGADLSVCDFQFVDEQGNDMENDLCLEDAVLSDKSALFSVLYHNWHIVPAWNKLYEKQLLSSLRFEFGKFHEDEFLIHQVLNQCHKAVMTHERLYYYRNRASSISNTKSTINILDTLEMEISRFEYCKLHNLPTRDEIVQNDYLDYVVGMKKIIPDNYMKRYYELYSRYKRVFFAQKQNRTIKKLLRFFCNEKYLKLNGIVSSWEIKK